MSSLHEQAQLARFRSAALHKPQLEEDDSDDEKRSPPPQSLTTAAMCKGDAHEDDVEMEAVEDEEEKALPPPPFLQMLTEDNMRHILEFIDPFSVISMSSSCHALRWMADDQHVWRELCLRHWPIERISARQHVLRSWRTVYHEVPHLRFSGCYLLTTSYTTPGGYGLTRGGSLKRISYYRVLRFFPDGRIHYSLRNGKQNLHKVMIHADGSNVCAGRYRAGFKMVQFVVNMGYMIQRFKLAYEEFNKGHHDRLIALEHMGKIPEDATPIRFRTPHNGFWFQPDPPIHRY